MGNLWYTSPLSQVLHHLIDELDNVCVSILIEWRSILSPALFVCPTLARITLAQPFINPWIYCQHFFGTKGLELGML